MLGLLIPVGPAESARAGEDMALEVKAPHQRLGITPRPFEEGLRLKIERRWTRGAP